MIERTDVEVWSDQLGEDGTQVIVTVSFDDTNPVCTNVTSSRRKRATVAFDQELLITIFSNPAV